MNGTALLIKEDYTVTVLEGVKEKQFVELKEEELTDKANAAVSFIYQEEAIDWEYGY